MWQIKNLDLRPTRLDFSSSGQGSADDLEWVADSIVLSNAIERARPKDDPFQAIVCDCCGYPGCGGGSYAALRRFGELVLLVPAFEKMSEGEWETSEFWPPWYIQKHGAPTFEAQEYERLLARSCCFPALKDIEHLKIGELAGIVQLEAHGEVMGRLDARRPLDRNTVLAVSDPFTEGEVDNFNEILERCRDDFSTLAPNVTPDQRVIFHLDLPGFPAWSPLGYIDGQPFLMLERIEQTG